MSHLEDGTWINLKCCTAYGIRPSLVLNWIWNHDHSIQRHHWPDPRKPFVSDKQLQVILKKVRREEKRGRQKEGKENETPQRKRWIFLIAQIKKQKKLFVQPNWILQQISVHHHNNPVIYEKRIVLSGRVPDDCGQLAYCQLRTISREIWMRFSHLFITASINGSNPFLTQKRALMENGIPWLETTQPGRNESCVLAQLLSPVTFLLHRGDTLSLTNITTNWGTHFKQSVIRTI